MFTRSMKRKLSNVCDEVSNSAVIHDADSRLCSSDQSQSSGVITRSKSKSQNNINESKDSCKLKDEQYPNSSGVGDMFIDSNSKCRTNANEYKINQNEENALNGNSKKKQRLIETIDGRKDRSRSVNAKPLYTIKSHDVNVAEHSCGLMDSVCRFCNALFFKQEGIDKQYTKCCHKGKVDLEMLDEIPQLYRRVV